MKQTFSLEAIKNWKEKATEFVFGQNNERLDTLVEAYYRLQPKHRTLIGAFLAIVGIGILAAGIFFYFNALSKLQSNMTTSLEVSRKIIQLDKSFAISHQKVANIKTHLIQNNHSLDYHNLFRAIAKDSRAGEVIVDDGGITMMPLAENDLFSQDFKRISIPITLPKTSLKGFIHFFIEVERVHHFLKVQQVSIEQSHDNKLYFTVHSKLALYVPK